MTIRLPIESAYKEAMYYLDTLIELNADPWELYTCLMVFSEDAFTEDQDEKLHAIAHDYKDGFINKCV